MYALLVQPSFLCGLLEKWIAHPSSKGTTGGCSRFFPLFCHLSAGQQVRNCPFFLQDRNDLWATHGVTCCCQCSLLGSCTEASLSAGYDFNIKCTIFCLAAIARNYKLSCTAHLKLRNSWGLTFYRWKYKAYWIYSLREKKKATALSKSWCFVKSWRSVCVRERGGERQN